MLNRRMRGVFAPLTIALIACLALGYGSSAQVAQPQEKVDLEVINKLKAEGLERSQVMETLSWLTDVHGPRLTNSTNYMKAAEWAKTKLASWGLQNSHLEAWGPFGRGWTLNGFTANMTKPQFAPLIAYPKAWSGSTNGVVRGQVVYLKADTEEQLAQYKGKLKGAIVLVAPPAEVKAHFAAQGTRTTDEQLLAMANADGQPGGRGQFGGGRGGAPTGANVTAAKWKMIYEEGAGIVLEPGRGDGGDFIVSAATMAPSTDPNAGFANRPRPQTKGASIIPQAVLTPEHYNRMIRILDKGVPVEAEFEIKASYQDQDEMNYNVIAEIPGTDLKDEIVMVGGHFDSWHSGTGATDNAAGSAVAMEVVRILKTLGLQPRRTIRIGLWGGEEEGLLGSRAYVEQHFGARQPLPAGQQPAAGGPGGGGGGFGGPQGPLVTKPEHAKFAGYFNLDNGTGKIRGVYLQGNDAVRPIFRAWLTPFKDMGASTITINNTGGTDHQSFDGVGLPGFQFIQDDIEYNSRTHHYNMDVWDRIQADDMKQAAVIIASFVYHTAMRDEKLPRKPMTGGPGAAGR
ncbi:MAG: M20/M25/M40 family metallo-hydrolase [Acidobacteria bacterium]|nr:M20/M25/M40 family metallo-hydrolase [Acidobacteriota bacterium]MBI3421901.1 M20/M25/M40 family metallo-hydrolase [Acidobacteriota bacterium]